MLLEEGACVNAIDTDGCTPLHLAAQDGHERIVRLLLRNGAIIDAMDRQGRTAGDLAQEHGHARVIASLEAFQQQVRNRQFFYLSKCKHLAEGQSLGAHRTVITMQSLIELHTPARLWSAALEAI